jgi:RimJ/RimL family protein N-acetyltransferase
VLRRWTIGDLSLVQSASIDPVIPRITSVPTTDDPDEARAFVERQDVRPTSGEGYSFAIADAASDEALGQIGLWPVNSNTDERASATGSSHASAEGGSPR